MNLNIRQLRKSQGFTMAELIIVIAILAVLIVYLVRNFGVRADDAKIAMVSNIMSKDVPAAFQAFILENNGCLSPDPTNNATNLGNILGGTDNTYTADITRTGIKLMLDNGVPAGTPWDNANTGNAQPTYTRAYTKWTADFVTSTGTAGAYLEVVYPLAGAGNISRAQTILETKLQNSSEIHSINGVVAAGGVGRTDITAAGTTAGSLTVRYACS
ncbi:MAG: type II secretion system protein [Pseudomonadota bacterium]|nr:type II secretion system protein [Pseudomonadota bacterium]